jgi:hypothetical protein
MSAVDPSVWTGRALQAECGINGGGWSCASVSGPCMERLCSWPSWISARTRSHSEKGPERPLGSPDHGRDGETVSPFPPSNSQTSAGIAVHSSVASGISVVHPLGGPKHVDPMRLLARHAFHSCDLVPTQSKRSAPAYWRVRLPGRYGVSVVPQP